MTGLRGGIAAALLAVLAGTSANAIVVLSISGKITSVNSALSSGFTVNQSISGIISYDDKVAPSGTSPNAYYYNTFSGSLTIGGKPYAFVPTDVLFVSNNNTYNQDQVSLYSSTSSGPSVGGYAPGYMTITLYDSTQAALSSTAVPTVAQLQSFPTKTFSLYFGTDYNHAVSGTISSITAVPEPAAWATMTLGFAALGLAMRRRGREAPLPA